VSTIRDIPRVDAWVPRTASFAEAAAALAASRAPAVAVLDDDRRVVGVFTVDALLRGLFPSYLQELRHTAFVEDDPDLLLRRAAEVSGEPVERHLTQCDVLDVDSSTTHAAERFLHLDETALPVTENGRFAGMLLQEEFAYAILRRATWRR
jgi:CBS domain-containing protein